LKTARRKRRINWLEIKRYYIEGVIDPKRGRHVFPTLDQVAERFHASKSSVYHRAAEEGWTRLRAEYLQRIAETAREETARHIAEALSETQVTLAVRAFQRFSEIADAAHRMLIDSDSLKPQGLKALVETMKIAFEQQRLILGQAQGHTTLNVKVSDWRNEIVAALKRRQISADEVREALGEEAEELLERAGL